MKKILTSAGSDCSGGAGIQADLKTITVHKQYGMSVITAVTAQNTLGVVSVWECPVEIVSQQLDCIFQDITPDAVKIGMIPNHEIAHVVAKKLVKYHTRNLVIDPVMVSTSGKALMTQQTIQVCKQELFPLAKLVTPNLPEAEYLLDTEITTRKEMEEAAERLHHQFGSAILLKGGHLDGDADDLLYDRGYHWFHTNRINNPNNHGTGCTLSSAIACGLSEGIDLQNSIKKAKQYLTGTLSSKLNLGHGNGPLDHMYPIK